MKWKYLAVLAFVLVALVAWDQWLMQRGAQRRLHSGRIEALLRDNPFQDRSVAAIRLDTGQGDVFLYAYQNGLWRCHTMFGAPAENHMIEALIPALRSAQGVVRSTDPQEAASFGFNEADSLRLSVSGSELFTHPTGDVIYAIDLGRSIPATGGAYVRPINSDAIWEIDVDFRAMLNVQSDVSTPPMLDPHIVPQAWPGVRLGPARVTIERQDHDTIVINRRQRDAAEDGLQWEWVVQQGESAYLGELFQVTSYAVFLTRAQYAGLLAPRPLEQLGLDDPQAIISYETAEGPRFQLIIGGSGPQGGIVVLNTFSQVLYEVEPDIVARILPEIDLLLSDNQGNPWERWMRR